MPPSSSTASSAVAPEHCFYCFEVINTHLQLHSPPTNSNRSQEGQIEVTLPDDITSYPLFVTWNIYPSSSALLRTSDILTGAGAGASPRLRGCIGTFEPRPLKEGLTEYARIAAFEDHRFSPISQRELSRLECGVSLLTSFEDCKDYLDWDLGTHGIYIHLTPPSASATDATHISTRSHRTLTATYLPDVPPEQGWSKEEAIESAIRKAGFEGKITQDLKLKALRVRRYQSQKITRNYNDWIEWREGQTE